MINRTGHVWHGEDFADLTEYLEAFTAESHSAGKIVPVRCVCGESQFRLVLDDDEGCARYRCLNCGHEAFIADSADYWDDADPGEAECPCGSERFERGVAYSLRDDGNIRWVTVGARCFVCGLLGAYVDWKIDYSPIARLFEPT